MFLLTLQIKWETYMTIGNHHNTIMFLKIIQMHFFIQNNQDQISKLVDNQNVTTSCEHNLTTK